MTVFFAAAAGLTHRVYCFPINHNQGAAFTLHHIKWLLFYLTLVWENLFTPTHLHHMSTHQIIVIFPKLVISTPVHSSSTPFMWLP